MPVQRHRTKEFGFLEGLDQFKNADGTTLDHPVTYSPLEKWRQWDNVEKQVREDGTLPPSNFYTEVYKPSLHIANGETQWRIAHSVPSGSNIQPRDDLRRYDSNLDWEYKLSPTNRAITALGQMSPFAPIISIPEMISDLVEATSLLRVNTRNALTLAGSAHLNYQFGWKTLISDLRTLQTITQSLEKRMLDYSRIYKRGGLRTKHVNFPKKTKHVWYQGASHTISLEIWTTCRWVPLDGVGKRIWPVTPDIPSPKLALRRAMDLGALDPKTLWDLMPFSWLIDYFTNIGDTLAYLSDTRLDTGGGTGITFDDVSVMKHRIVTVNQSKFEDVYGMPYQVTKGFRNMKQRDIVSNGDIDLGLIPNLLDLRTPKGGQWNNTLALISLLLGNLKK